MKKKILPMIIVLLLCIAVIQVSADDCTPAVKQLENKGYLYVKIDGEDAFVAIEPLIWKNAAYKTKLGIVSCVRKVYRAYKLFLVSMDHPDDLIATFDGVKFKIY